MKWIVGALLMAGSTGLGSTISADFPEKSQFKTDVAVGSRYVYNVFYDFLRAVNDAVLTVKPEIRGNTKPSGLFVDAGASGLYEKYLKNSIQDHFDYEGFSDIYINEGGPQSFIVSGRYKSFSDLAPSENYARIERSAIDGNLRAKIKGQRGNSFDISAHYNMDLFNNKQFAGTGQADPKFLSNNTIEGTVQYNNNFLPETAWILRASGGKTTYPNPAISMTNNSLALGKNGSFYAMAETGFVGRLTDKSTIDFASGFLVRNYEETTAPSQSFSGPVFYLRFTEQITRRDQLMAGYNYVVKESYWSNYVLDQEIYIGLARVMGDQVLLLTRIGYSYRSYSLPLRRDDERIGAGFMIKYSLSPTIKLTADLKVDLLSSDAFFNGTTTETTPPTNPNGTLIAFPDRPASYKAGSFGLGVVASF